ncbi:MAG: carboxypeptidase-like regulatory domain-containing protein, partial [Muribaculaceae bacterium]|nr:carboxypeptidase-like regulatory domain-containing protein [Muribaculaceae bacterium]
MLMKTRFLILLSFLCIGFMSAKAQFEVKGTVIDGSNGEPLIGASILENGTRNGTTTDLDGQFKLNVKSGNVSIVVSYVGYASKKVAVQNRHEISITLDQEDNNLDELVVVGYGVQKKSDLTGAVSSVSSNDIKGLATTDAGAALQGKAAGVQILNTSGAPGEGAKIRIRGYSSNSGELGPLLIVDGLKVDNIQYLDPSMIESMEVLKDAASAAIYGAQAGNGVILITTKNGAVKNGQPKVVYQFKAINQRLGKTPEIFGAQDFIT